MKKLLPLLFFFLSVTPVLGQEAVSITAIPPRLELEALPGTTLQETIKVRNDSTSPLAFQVTASDFVVNNSQGTPVAVTEAVSGRWSLASWVSFSPKKILLQPQETNLINLVINIPKDALPGGHYSMITYNPDLTGTIGEPGSSSSITQKVGTLIYFNVIGDAVEAANLKEFKVDNFFSHYGPINLMAEIENLGDVHFAPSGKISITNLLGKTVFSQALEEKNIFPFASRTYSWQIPGKYRFGRYMARLEASAGSTQIPVNGLIYFWIIPVKESLIAAAMLGLLLLAILISRRKKQPTPPIQAPETIPPTI